MELYLKEPAPFPLLRINVLGADDHGLLAISEDRQLALSLEEMGRVQEFFRREGRNPTDVEIEALAQAWSEHSCYKSSWPVMQGNIFRLKAPQNLLVIAEDAGVVEFDEEHAYVVALESHNHPSALDPVGGAETGIGGILRDVLCMGAQPIALVDPLFFGPLDLPFDALPPGTKHPRYLFQGVVGGIRDYGNRVGIPTVGGMVYFHPGYVGNCLVNVGCVGMLRKDGVIRSRSGGVGEVFILAGGLTGRDGIHGVSSLASTILTETSEQTGRAAVQMGDAIMKEPLIHACLEAVEAGLVSGLKDCGGGGLSSCVGELAFSGGNGCWVDMDKVPLKVEDMLPWEIWVSESQERMVLSIAPEKVEEVLAIFRSWDVPANAIGRTTDTRHAVLLFRGYEVCNLDLEFYTGAVRYKREQIAPKASSEPIRKDCPKDLDSVLLELLSSPNLASREYIVRQYDHEVRGNTVVKPLQGNLWRPTHGDAAVLKPLEDSFRGLALTTDVNPALTSRDPFWGAAAALEEAFRNLVAVGARPHSWADNLNFGNPEKPERMGEFQAATDGLYLVANELGVPCVSGNVSFYNESPAGAIPPTPTIFAIGLVEDVRKCVTADIKGAGNSIYVIGETNDEMGGSEYAGRILGEPEGGTVPQVHPAVFREKMERLLSAIGGGLVASCHDLSEGGLGVGIAEMLIGGEVGCRLDVSKVPGKASRPDFALFSESNGRWLVEVRAEKAEEFEKRLAGIAFAKIGETMAEKRLRITGKGIVMDLAVGEMGERWEKGMAGLVGE